MKLMILEFGAMESDITVVDVENDVLLKRHFNRFKSEDTYLDMSRVAYIMAKKHKVDKIIIDSHGVGSYIAEIFNDMVISEFDDDLSDKIVVITGKALV